MDFNHPNIMTKNKTRNIFFSYLLNLLKRISFSWKPSIERRERRSIVEEDINWKKRKRHNLSRRRWDKPAVGEEDQSSKTNRALRVLVGSSLSHDRCFWYHYLSLPRTRSRGRRRCFYGSIIRKSSSDAADCLVMRTELVSRRMI